MVKRRNRWTTVSRTRTQERSPSRPDELLSARDRFRGALQELLPRSEEDSDSGSDDDNWSKSKKQSKKKLDNDKAAAAAAAAEEEEKQQQQQPFVMKLFDRSVDLAQFTDSTPLYVICRAWMANQPHQTYSITVPPPKRPHSPEIKEEPMSPGKEEEIVVKDTYWLPPPSSRDDRIDGHPRIPKTVPRTTKLTKMFEDGDESPPSRNVLLEDNLNHWHKVRRSWLDASKRNELRYDRSLKTLAAIFDKAQPQQSP